jgi:hypothetical protein
VHWTGGEPACPHVRLEATVEGGLACVDCGAMSGEPEAPVAEAQVRYVVRGRLNSMDVHGEWESHTPARFAAESVIAQGGRATLLKVTTEELPTSV